MLKNLLMAVCILFYVQTATAYDEQKVASKAQKVTVFLNSAQVGRTATVGIQPGTSVLVFNDLSPDIDVQSIQVKSAGSFTILSVKHELNFLNEQLKEKRVEELEAQKKIVQDKLDMQNNLLVIYQEESNMLLKNQTVSNNNLDLIKLRQALEFQTARLTEIRKKQQDVKNQLSVLNMELQKYNKQLDDLTRGNTKATSNILVTVSAKAAVQAVFALNYVVKNANWYPTYDVRAKDVNSPVNISYKANVSQQCGEDWRDVKLTLSTGNPTVNGSNPELTPDYLDLGMYFASQGNISRVTGKVFDGTGALPGVSIIVKGTTIGTTTDAAGMYSIQIPAGAQTLVYKYVGFETREMPVSQGLINVELAQSSNALNEVVVMGYSSDVKQALAGKVAGVNVTSTIPIAVKQVENQTNVEFVIDDAYSIPADGKQYSVEIGNYSLPASYQYYVAPKISTDVFLTATLTDWNKYNFLSGEANLFFEGTFIGKSLIDTYSTSDTLNFSLGTDRGIAVTRILQKDITEKKNSGSTKKETRDWLISIKNRKNQPVKLLVEDQVPVSKNTSIEVEVQDVSGAVMDATTGKLSWHFMLTSLQDEKVNLKYQVKYPKNQSVIVQ